MPDKEPAHHGSSPAKPENGVLEAGVPPDKWTRWMIAIAVMVSAVMELVDTSAVNVSLPYIAGNLSASVDEATWVLTSYNDLPPNLAKRRSAELSEWLSYHGGPALPHHPVCLDHEKAAVQIRWRRHALAMPVLFF